ncbi:MAG: hypothetical protein CSB13_07075 [Chloroflexi bacterium]|nr:MAG: hypothetical protein CSB13_07075 [Chloroflexota bacterium]
MTSESTPHPTKQKRIIFWALFTLIIVFVAWLGIKTWRIYHTGQALLDRKTEIETLVSAGITNIDPEKAESLVMDTRADIHTLKSETAVFMPLTPYLGWVPKVGPTLTAAPAFMAMAESGIDAAAYAIRGLKPALIIWQNPRETEASMLSQLSEVLVDAAPDLAAANHELSEVAAARSHITNTQEQPEQIQTWLNLSDTLLPFAQKGLTLTAVLPEMLGRNGARTYLVIAQNQDELRPTGGFISGAGTLVVENGSIENLQMVDAYRIDNWQEKPYDFPPQPFYDYMGIDLFLFRDSNFWPDFPTSAEKAMDLYSYGQDLPPLDGLIALDQEFFRLLVEATGPIFIEESNLTITSQNSIETLQNAWSQGSVTGEDEESNADWFKNRKAFIGIFATAILDYIENDFSAVDPLRLIQNIQKAIDEKHIQLYMRDPTVQSKLDDINWDNRLENQQGQDFLAIAETNMGFNKVNHIIERSIHYHATLDADEGGTAKLNITYTHPGQGKIEDCIQFDWGIYNTGGNYLELTDRCYWNYLRVYVPGGSQLISATEHTVPGQAMRSGNPVNTTANTLIEKIGLTTFDNFLMVPYGQDVTSEFHYTLPKITNLDGQGTHQYQLTIQKQAGTGTDPVEVLITLPPGKTLLTAEPSPVSVNGQQISFSFALNTDKTISLTYQ